MYSASLIRCGVLFLVSCVAHGWEYGWPEEWNDKWSESAQEPFSDDCTTSHLKAFEMAKPKTSVFYSTGPKDDFEAPKILPLNSTAGEQWEFDGIAEDGLRSFIFGFYRDPNYAILGSGNFRLSVEITHANGTRFAQVDYPSESIVSSCADGTRGVWRSKDFSYTFEINKDMSRARIGLNTPRVKGNVFIKNITPPRYADGSTWPSETASTEAVPFFNWVEPIPVGTVDVDLVVQGETYQFSGMGGHERLWGAFSWFTCLQGMTAVRTMLGPYALSYVSFVSNIEKGLFKPSVVLSENGKQIFSSTLGNESSTEDYVRLTKTYGGAVTGTLRDKVTGYELELVSPETAKHFTFIIEHRNVGFEYILGEGVGGSGFSGSVRGGHIGMEQFDGIAFTEALTFPKKSPLFKSNYRDEL
ncbi:MAG: hypothetical protein M4579_006170 [Chaenotheca gracillima]|nr:MAG: hypothetical protein M4579_006170 [Chaenotheca gracillima]